MSRNYQKWILIVSLTALTAGAGLLVRDRIRRVTGVPLNEEQREELRQKLDDNPRSIFTYDPQISYRLKPGFRGIRHDSPGHLHLTNSWGLLGEEEVNPDPAVRKILFLGDSVAYGSHVLFEEIFITRMGQKAEKSYQLLNASCPGWSTHQELSFYRRHLTVLPIDTVVIVFTINDLLLFEWVWRDESSFQMSAELRGIGGLTHSRLTDLEIQRIRNRFQNSPELRPLAELNNTCLTAYLHRAWLKFQKDIEPNLSDLTEKRTVILAPVPARAQLEALNRGGDTKLILFPQHRLEKLARELKIGFLDLLPAFRAEDGGWDESLFLPGQQGDLHLSPKGHRRLARWLWPELLKSLSPSTETISSSHYAPMTSINICFRADRDGPWPRRGKTVLYRSRRGIRI